MHCLSIIGLLNLIFPYLIQFLMHLLHLVDVNLRRDYHLKSPNRFFCEVQDTELVNGVLKALEVIAVLKNLINVHRDHSQGNHVIQADDVGFELIVLIKFGGSLSRNGNRVTVVKDVLLRIAWTRL